CSSSTFEDNSIHCMYAGGITDAQVGEEVRKNSTFVLEKGLIDPNHVSFRSARFPDLFIQQVNFQLFARPARPQFPDEFEAATFRMVTPPLNAADMCSRAGRHRLLGGAGSAGAGGGRGLAGVFAVDAPEGRRVRVADGGGDGVDGHAGGGEQRDRVADAEAMDVLGR